MRHSTLFLLCFGSQELGSIFASSEYAINMEAPFADYSHSGRRLDSKWSSLCNWVLAAVCIWGFDRLVRFIRIVWYNLKLTKTGLTTSRASVYAHESGFMQIDVRLARDWTFVPGQYVYISFGGSHRCESWTLIRIQS